MTTIFWPFCLRPGVMVKWSKISKLPWSNGQNWSFLTMTMVTISELLRSNGRNRSILAIDHGQNRGCHGHGQCLTPPDLRHRTGPSSSRLDLDSSTCK